jgi:PAS domain S-box-containing protein
MLSGPTAQAALSFLADSRLFGFFEYDFVSGTLACSAETLRRFGFSGAEPRVRFSEVWERVVPGDRERLSRAAAAGAPAGHFSAVFRIHPPNDDLRWMQLQAWLERSPQGEPLRWVGIVLDASSALAEEILRQEARDQVVTLVDSVAESFIALDRDFRFTFVNQRVLDWLGKPLDAVIGQSIWEIFPEAVGTLLETEYRRVASERVHRSFVVPYPANDGRLWLEVNAFPIADGVAALVRNITDLKAAQDALSASEERFRRAQQAANIGAFEWDLLTNRMTWAAKVPTFTEVADADDFGGYLRYVDPADLPELNAAVQRILQGGQHSVEVRIHPPDGRLLWFYFRAEAVFGEDGRPVRMYGVAIDVTERKLAEENLRTSEKLAATGRLAATIAHEINNPLAAVTNLLYLATQTSRTLDENRDYLIRAENELQRVAAIVRQTLGFYRGTATAAPLDLGAVLREAINLFESRFASRTIRLLEEIAPGVTVLAVEGEIRQIVTNLVSNAIDASEQGGLIQVRLWIHNGGAESAASGSASLEIRDNGRGIPPEIMNQLFQPFFTTKQERGTGLGLWVSRELARKNGGTIEATSAGQGQGSTFLLTLPLAPAQP